MQTTAPVIGGAATLELGQASETREEFGDAAGAIGRLSIDPAALAAFVYDRIHSKSAPVAVWLPAEKRAAFYHRTSREIARRIIKGGFRDGAGRYNTETERKGVWLSDRPLSEMEGARGDTLLEVSSFQPRSFFDEFEWIEEGKTYREWLVPAHVINEHCAALELTEEEAERRRDRHAGTVERTDHARAAYLAAALLPSALAYNFEKIFAFTLRSVEKIALAATLAELRVDHEKLVKDFGKEIATGLKSLHRKAGKPKGPHKMRPDVALMLSLFYDFQRKGQLDSRAARNVQRDPRMGRALPKKLRDPLKKIRRAERRAKSLGLSRIHLTRLADKKL